MFTEDQIESLINCPKKITDGPKNSQFTRGSMKREFTMTSQDGKHVFRGFLSQNETFPENFSLGLVFEDKEERDRICLLRCNGKHGGVKDIPHHFESHVHRVSAEDLNNGIRAEKNVEITKEYATYEDGIQFYLKLIGINEGDRQKYFPRHGGNIQNSLFADLPY